MHEGEAVLVFQGKLLHYYVLNVIIQVRELEQFLVHRTN